MDASCRLARRLLPVVLAALMASGCVAVDPGPGQPSTHPSLAPAAAMPPVELAEASQPPARWALADTGPDHPRKHHRAHQRGHDHEGGRQLPPPVRRHVEHTERQAAAEPVAPPRRRHPAAAAPKPTHRSAPRRTHRPETAAAYDMRNLCRAAADNQVNAAIVDLCQDTYGH
ncbi:hypothetical protein [Streptomyces pseudovenezuelae]|uniref:hypothetical protein n=1 Tax=Streptomyces pseudovenezuelae TaxID=67350 RepID=UPI0036E3A2FA